MSNKTVSTKYIKKSTEPNYKRLKFIEIFFKKYGAYICSSVEGKGCHIGRFKELGLDADGNIVIEVDIDKNSVTS